MLREVENVFTIGEDTETCETRLARKERNKLEEVRLYRVVVSNEVFVLADSKEGAISQAKCIMQNEDAPSGVANATLVPFGVRGWGKVLF